MKHVYIVTQGQYSSYSIVAVFSTKAAAEKFLEIHANTQRESWDEMRIEEHTLNTTADSAIYWFVRMSKSGEAKECSLTEYSYGIDPQFDVEQNLVVHIRAKTQQQAIKRANEIRSQLIATDRWPTA